MQGSSSLNLHPPKNGELKPIWGDFRGGFEHSINVFVANKDSLELLALAEEFGWLNKNSIQIAQNFT